MVLFGPVQQIFYWLKQEKFPHCEKVALLGLKSLFGQTSSLLLKQCPSIYNLRLYDETDISAAHDLSIINTRCKVEAYQGKNNLNKAVKDSDIVLIGDDFHSTPVTSFDIMAPKMQEYAKAIAESSPNAVVIVAASPVNKLVPVLSELLSENGIHDCNKLIGATAVNNVRANCILASYVHSDPRKVFLPIIGGDSEETIVPLFSQAKPLFNLSEVVTRSLIDQIRKSQAMIYEMKGKAEALNKAYSTSQFLKCVIAGLKGEPNIMSVALTKTAQVDGTEYFALPVLLGRFGVQARFGIPKVLSFESDLINESVFNINKDIEYAKLFCKSRDTAIEFCSRNVANRFQKSKEFEKFVNDLKKNKKLDKCEDKLPNKLKPPLPIENKRLASMSADKPFDAIAFCLKHQYTPSKKKSIIPPYMKSGTSIVPSLPYTFPKYNRNTTTVPNYLTCQTPICESIQCPDQQKETPLDMSNIVSFVEKIVKKTTHEIMMDMEKKTKMKVGINMSHQGVDKCKEKVFQDVQVGKETHLNDSKSEINRCRSKGSNSHTTFEQFNRKDCKSSGKSKYSEMKLESIFRPAFHSFQRINESTLGVGRLGVSTHPKQVELNKHTSDITMKKYDILNEPQNTKSFYNSEKEGNKIRNDPNHLPIEKPIEFKSKLGSSNEFSNLNEAKYTNDKSRRIKRVLNLLNDTKPKQSAYLKRQSEHYYRKDISPLEVKKEDEICTQGREIKPDYLKVIDRESVKQNNKLKSSEKNVNEKSTTEPTKHKKKFNYFNQRYKSGKIFSKILINKNGEPKTKTSNDEKPPEFIDQNKKSENFEPVINEKSIGNVIINNNYKTQNSINSKSIGEVLNIQNYKPTDPNVASVNQFKESKEETQSTESKVEAPKTSNCYNASENELKKVNDNTISCNESVINNIANTIDNKQLCSKLNDSEYTSNHDLKSHLETCSTQTEINGKLNIVLKMLDNDVFKCNILNTEKTIETNADEKQKNGKMPSLYNQQNSIEEALAPTIDQIVHGESIQILSGNKEQTPLVEETYQPTHENKILKSSETKFDESCDEKQNTSQPTDENCNSTALSLDKDQILSSEVKSQSLENFKVAQPKLKPDFIDPNNKHLLQVPLKYSATTSKKNKYKLSSELNKSKKYKSNSEHYKPKIIVLAKKFHGSNKNDELKSQSQQYCSSFPKSSKLGNKVQLKSTGIGNTSKKQKTISTVKSVKQISRDNKQNKELSISKTRAFHNYGSKIKPSNTNNMNKSFNAEILNTLNKINKSEHSFRIKDKNGMNNFFLLKGLLPQIENFDFGLNSKMSGNKHEKGSKLKTKVYNEDPFIPIQHKMPSKIMKDNAQLLPLKKKNEGCHTTNKEDKGKDSLLITHNYVYSPHCPVHSYKYYLDKNQLKSKTTLKKDYEKPSLEDSNILSNLTRISSKINVNKRNSSSHQLSQKAPYFKPYSTSTQSRHKSPSRLLFNSKKPYCNVNKGLQPLPALTRKLNSYIQKQRVTKILEQGIKKMSPFSHNINVLKNTSTNESEQRDRFKSKVMNKAQVEFSTGAFIPCHSTDSSRSVKITEKFYNSAFGSSYALRSLNNPPNWMPCQNSCMPFSRDGNKQNEKPSITRMKNHSCNINCSLLHNNSQKFNASFNSRENDILERGTCLDHVKQNFTAKANRFLGNCDVCNNQEKIDNPIASTNILEAYTESTKNEYSKSHKIPSIRQLHKNAFRPS